MRVTSHLIWVLTLLLSPYVRAAVLAIDYGAEFTKLSLIKPGVPFDVVLDKDSKRKISSVVGWKRDDRVFGADGKMAVSPSVICLPMPHLCHQASANESKGNSISRNTLPLCEITTWILEST